MVAQAAAYGLKYRQAARRGSQHYRPPLRARVVERLHCWHDDGGNGAMIPGGAIEPRSHRHWAPGYLHITFTIYHCLVQSRAGLWGRAGHWGRLG